MVIKYMFDKIIHFIKGYKIIEYKGTNIYIIEKAVDISFCNIIIDSIDASEIQNVPISNMQNVECYKVQNLHALGLNDLLNEKMLNIITLIHVLCPKINISGFSQYELRKIYGETKQHCDGVYSDSKDKMNVRSATIVVNLNENYSGGVYSFPYHNIEFRLKSGSAVVFPPFWTHPHKVSKVGDGENRYIFSTWCLE